MSVLLSAPSNKRGVRSGRQRDYETKKFGRRETGLDIEYEQSEWEDLGVASNYRRHEHSAGLGETEENGALYSSSLASVLMQRSCSLGTHRGEQGYATGTVQNAL